jgi:hypothetical protein
MPNNPFWNHISTSITPNLNLKNGQHGKTRQFGAVFSCENRRLFDFDALQNTLSMSAEKVT